MKLLPELTESTIMETMREEYILPLIAAIRAQHDRVDMEALEYLKRELYGPQVIRAWQPAEGPR